MQENNQNHSARHIHGDASTCAQRRPQEESTPEENSPMVPAYGQPSTPDASPPKTLAKAPHSLGEEAPWEEQEEQRQAGQLVVEEASWVPGEEDQTYPLSLEEDPSEAQGETCRGIARLQRQSQRDHQGRSPFRDPPTRALGTQG